MNSERLGTPIVVNGITITPLERVKLYRQTSENGFLVYGSKEPIGVLIESQGRKWALDIHGHPIPLDAIPGSEG